MTGKPMASDFTDSELAAYLDEALPTDLMSAIESTLRTDRGLADRLAAIVRRRDAGVHSLGEVWRSARLTCPAREQLGGLLLETLDDGVAEYVRFHVETLACRQCQANLADLRAQAATADPGLAERRIRYFQSSAGYLRRDS